MSTYARTTGFDDESSENEIRAMASPKNPVTISVAQSTFIQFQFGIVTVLVILCAFNYVYTHTVGIDLVAKATNIFDLGLEESIPTAFASMNLLIASILAFCLFRRDKSLGKSKAIYWLILSLFFLAMATDEVAGFHERVSKLREYTGILIPVASTYAWLPYGAALAAILFLTFLPFLAHIERNTALLLVLSGAIFLTGAMGFEFLNGWLLYKKHVGSTEFMFYFIKLFEEGFELYGIALLNSTLFASLASSRFGLTLNATS
jgi:hypothetical protein